MAKMISADEAQNLLDAATPGPWVVRGAVSYDGPTASVRADHAGSAYPITGTLPSDRPAADAEMIAAAPDLAATVLDLHKRLAAERCEPEGAASERWECGSDRWVVKAAPWWNVRRATGGGDWLVGRGMEFVHAEPYALDAMRWCDEQDAGK